MKPIAATTLLILVLIAAACAGPTPTPVPTPTVTSTPAPSATPTKTPTPTPGPCAGEWVGEWTQVHFQTVTGSIVLPTYTVEGKLLTLNDDCTYIEDWSEESSDIGCNSVGLIEGEFEISGDSVAFVAVETLEDVDLDCGAGAQIAGSAATTPLDQIDPPGYVADLSALPDELVLVASFASNEGFNIEVSQVFEP